MEKCFIVALLSMTELFPSVEDLFANHKMDKVDKWTNIFIPELLMWKSILEFRCPLMQTEISV